VLVVEDDSLLRIALERALKQSGFGVDVVATIGSARRALGLVDYNLVLLDRKLPDGDGLDLCRELRSAHSAQPVLILSSLTEDDDVLAGLLAQADDYVTKPVRTDLLVARMYAILRRSGSESRKLVGDLGIDLCQRSLSIAQRDHPVRTYQLSMLEARFLAKLLDTPNVSVARDVVHNACYGGNVEISDNAIDAMVKRLRHKLGEDADRVETTHRKGFLLRVRCRL